MINSFSYYAIYSALAAALILLVYFKVETKFLKVPEHLAVIIKITIVVAIIGLLAAVRPYNSADTANYFGAYTSASNPSFYFKEIFVYGSRINGIETFFVFLIAILKSLNISFRQVLFIIAVTNASIFIYAAIKIAEEIADNYEENKILALFVSAFGMHYCCIAIRAGLSLSVGLLTLYLFITRRYIRGTLSLYISILLHSMSVIFIPIILFMCISNNRELSDRTNRCLYLPYVICIVSLTLNLGSRLIDGFIVFFELLSGSFGITSFAGYMVGIDRAVGIKDWVIVLAIGLALLSIENESILMKKACWVIMIGLIITSWLYPIRAINRAADYFYLLIMPVMSTYVSKEYFPKGSLFAEYLMYPLLLLVQFKL